MSDTPREIWINNPDSVWKRCWFDSVQLLPLPDADVKYTRSDLTLTPEATQFAKARIEQLELELQAATAANKLLKSRVQQQDAERDRLLRVIRDTTHELAY